MLDQSGYLKALREENTEEAESRIQNLAEFVSTAREYEEREPEASIGGFVDRLSLLSEADESSGLEQRARLADDDARGQGPGVPGGGAGRAWRRACSRTRERARTRSRSRRSGASATWA